MSAQNSSPEGLLFFGNYTPHFPEPPALERHAELVALACLYTVVLFVGILGNGSLLVALLSQQSLRVRSPLLVALCAADLLVCACAAPLAAAGPAPPAAPLCALLAYSECFPVAASTLSLMMISVDRYATVHQPRLLAGLQRRPVLGAALAWLGAALLAGAPALAAALPPCSPCEPLDVRSAALLAHTVLAYIVPTVVVLACHLGVRSKLCALSLTARAAHGELPLPMPLLRRPTHVIIVAGMANSAQTQAVTYCDGERRARRESRKGRSAPSGGPVRGASRRRESPGAPGLLAPQPQASTLQSRRRLANVLVSVAAVFAGCWLPHAACCLYAELHADAPEYLLRYSLLLGHAHSAVSPVVYWALNHHTLGQPGCLPCGGGAAQRFLFHLKLHDEQPPSSTNEAALGPFHPRYTRARPRVERCAPSSHYLY